jgi:hypothetical protein|tara:strand:+ start:2072 stop:2287 length:216 start_codon:yes stop_codon:yes gene_type:complete
MSFTTNPSDWIDFWESEVPTQLTMQRQNHIDELEKSIIALAKHKMKLLSEVQEINNDIEFLRKQQEDLSDV